MAMTSITETTQCQISSAILQQRRSAALFHIPLQRFSLISPYPQYTVEQLNMRRKVEILKYSNVQSNTKTNNPTKSERWASLMRTRTKNVINYELTPPCIPRPILTTSCNVPGPPIYLQLDPTVPLYNYIPAFANRSYGISPGTTVQLNLYTINELLLSESTDHHVINVSTNVFSVERQLGSLIFTNYAEPDKAYPIPKITVPIGLYISLIIGCESYDASGNIISKRPITDLENSSIVVQIQSIIPIIKYNGTLITPIRAPSVSIYPSHNPYISIPCSQLVSISAGVYYAIQYTGMLTIDGLILPSAQNLVYDIDVSIECTCNINDMSSIGSLNSTTNPLDYFDALSSSVVTNLNRSSVYLSSDPTIFESLSNVTPESYSTGSFTLPLV